MIKHSIISAGLFFWVFILTSFSQPANAPESDLPQIVLQTGHSSKVENLRFTPDEKYLLSESEDRIIIWDVGGDRILSVIENETLSDLSKDGAFLATLDLEENFIVREIKTGRKMQELKGVYNCSFTLSGKLTVCQSKTVGIIVINPLTPKPVRYISFSERILEDFAFGSGDKIVVSSRVVLKQSARTNEPLNFIEVYEPGQKQPVFTLTDKISWGLSTDGKFLIAEDEAKTVTVYDLTAKNNLVLSVKNIESWDLSTESNFFVGLTENKTLNVWSLADRQIKFSRPAQNYVSDFSFTPGEKYLYSQKDGTLEFYNLEQNAAAAHLTVNKTGYSTEFSPNGRLLAVTDEIGEKTRLSLWDLEAKKLIFSAPETTYVDQIVFSRDSRTLLVESTRDGKSSLTLWETATGQAKKIDEIEQTPTILEKLTPLTPPQTVMNMKMSTTGSIEKSQTITLGISLSKSNKRQTLAGFSEYGHEKLIFSPQNKSIVRGMENGRIAFWETANGKRTRTLGSQISPVEISFGTVNKNLIISDGMIEKFWDFQNGGFIGQKAVPIPKPAATASPDFLDLYDIEPDEGEYALVNKKTGKDYLRLTDVNNCEISNNYKLLACYKYLNVEDEVFTLQVIDLRTKRTIFRIPNVLYDEFNSKEIFSNDYLTLAVTRYDQSQPVEDAADNRRLEIWSVKGLPLFTSAYGLSDYILTDDRKYAVLEFDDRLEWHDLKTKSLIKKFVFQNDFYVGVKEKIPFPSPSGKHIAFTIDTEGGAKNRIYVWNTVTNRLFWDTQHAAQIFSTKFSPDERFLLSSSKDGTVKVWDITKEKLILTLVPLAQTDWLVFDPSGRFDYSKGAARSMNWRIGGDLITFEQLKTRNEQFLKERYVPNLWQKTLALK